ncbi:hypothetical protein BGX31_007966 [Mortierella sp. GBA43]|nr:hypothetical protein BGX31_007966 [Mortierella sp. GBA43]
MSLNSQTDQQQDHEGIPASEWTMDKVVQWLQSKPQLGDEFIPLFLEHQICGKAFITLSQNTLKTLDPNSRYYQRRRLLLEIKDAVEGTKSATSVSSTGPDNANTPSPASASPVLNRIGSGSRPSPYSNANNSSTNVSVTPEVITVRTNVLDDGKFTRSPAEETPGSTIATPMALQPQPRPSIDAIEPLDDGLPIIDYLPQPARPTHSPRPRSDPDPRQLPGRLPAQVTIETMEYAHKAPSIAPRQSSIAYSFNALRPNLNIPPPIVPRSSSKDFSVMQGLNVPQSGRGMSPVSPPSPGGLNYPYPSRGQEASAATSAAKNPSLNERRNNPSVPHIQTQSLAANGANGTNGTRNPYEVEPGTNHPSLHSNATVVGGTLGFGRRPSHKRNHSSADVIQYQPTPPPANTPPKPMKIQVTLDNDIFRYVDITGIDNAVVLKESIFSRMNIIVEKNKYGIFQTTEFGGPVMENDASRGPPLTDKELMDLLQSADNNGSVKLLVTPVTPLYLPPNMDILNPKKHTAPVQSHPHYASQGRSSPYQGPVYTSQDAGFHSRDRTTDSTTHHLYQLDPYTSFVQTPEDLGSIHPHQPYADSKHPHSRHPHQGSNGTMMASPYGSYQQPVYQYVDNPGHPHYQPDDARRPSVGPNSAGASPRFGPVVNTSVGRMHKSTNSPGTDGTLTHSPLGSKRILAKHPNLSLVIGSNTDQDGKLVNHHPRTSDRSASPHGHRPPRDRMQSSHDSSSPNPSYYGMGGPNHPGFGDVPMVGPTNYPGSSNSGGLPASPLSAGAVVPKRGSLQPVTKYGSSHSLNSPHSSAEGGPNGEMNSKDYHCHEDETENYWGERPPLDFLYENFGRFFQDHDLDHPIIELHPPTPYSGTTMVSAQTILGSQQGMVNVAAAAAAAAASSSTAMRTQESISDMTDAWGSNSTISSNPGNGSPPQVGYAKQQSRASIIYKKSIRVVAEEAKARFSRQYSGSKVMRRKSTKFWGSPMVEVMPTNPPGPNGGGMAGHEYDEELSPIAGSPAGPTLPPIADMIKEVAREHHLIPESPLTQEPLSLSGSQENVSTVAMVYHQQQLQQRVIQVESGMVMDQSQQGIYQNPQNGAIKTFQYLKGGLIGRGSFGRVYHAFNLDTCEMIAIKEVDLPQTRSERNSDRLKTSVEALFSEMEVLKDLDHENIDIKAANVLVDEQGVCKISDFGISKRNAQHQGGYDEDVGSLQGSIFWMAPEMVTSKAYGAKVDIWSFGCLVLEMFTGQQPWKDYTPHQALFTIGSRSAHPPIPENICQGGQKFLARCFITDANNRPTASELLKDPFAVPPPNYNFNDYIEGKITD